MSNCQYSPVVVAVAAVVVEDIGGAVQLGPGEDDVVGEPPSATLDATSCSSQARWASVKDAATSLSLSDMVVGSSQLDPRKCTGTGMLLAFYFSSDSTAWVLLLAHAS